MQIDNFIKISGLPFFYLRDRPHKSAWEDVKGVVLPQAGRSVPSVQTVQG